GIDIARAAVVRQAAILHRLAGALLLSAVVAGLLLAAVRTRTGIGLGGALGLILELLDQLIEAGHHFLLDLLCLGSAAGQLEPALDVIHLAGDLAQVLLTPR